jgi:transketolase
MLSTREAYGAALASLADQYKFYVFDSDLAKATQTAVFGKKCPDRFIDMGIAEANMMSHAAGFAASGATVFASTFAQFAAGRAYDQVRNSIAYPNLNVKIGATHGGVLIGADGGSHQCIEDLSLMRIIPNMVVLSPADEAETYKCVEAAIEHTGCVYLRFSRFAAGQVYASPEECPFEIGKGIVLRDGTDVTLIGIGDLVPRCMEAAIELEKKGISAAVIDMACLKPIDKELILRYAKKTGCFVTAEDHNVIGGLCGAVSEVLSQNCPVPLEAVGVADTFGRSGEPAELAEVFGLTAANIVAQAKKAVMRKSALR